MDEFNMKTCDKLKKDNLRRTFSDSWLNDIRFKSWLRKVPLDPTLFRCNICNKTFSSSSLSHITRHAQSASHKKNVRENTSLFGNSIPNNSELSKKKLLRKKKFMQRWLDIKPFKPWLREVQHDSSSFFCTICDKINAGGLSQIYRHSKSKIHRYKFGKCDIQMSELNNELNVQIDESFLLFEEQKKSAEIRFAALIADKNVPHETAKMILRFFQDIGKNPYVLKNMRINQTECTNIISSTLCSTGMNYVLGNIQNRKFSIIIGDISNEKRISFYVRYVNETSQVHSQLLKVFDIDTTDYNVEKLFNAFKNEMYKFQISFSNIIAVSCNNILTGKHIFLKKKLKEMCKNILMLPCPCYSITLATYAACAKIPQVCEEFVQNVVNYVNSCSKRMAFFYELSECFQERNHKILKLSDMRWLSRYACIEKLLEFWDTIKHFLTETVEINGKTESEKSLLYTMQNVDIKAYLLFLKYSLHFLNIFNELFQTEETRIHLLQPKSIDLLTKICTNFLNPKVLKDLPNIIFDKVENHRSLSDINLGLECEEYLCQLIHDGYMNVVATVRQNCLQFYITAAEEVYKRLPVNDIFLSKLQIFLPHVALLDTDRETSFIDLSFIAKTIGGFNENDLKKEWFALNFDFTTIEKQDLSVLNFDDMWIQILQSQHSNDNIKYPNLKLLLNSIRSIPNFNTDSEKIFSLTTDIKTEK